MSRKKISPCRCLFDISKEGSSLPPLATFDKHLYGEDASPDLGTNREFHQDPEHNWVDIDDLTYNLEEEIDLCEGCGEEGKENLGQLEESFEKYGVSLNGQKINPATVLFTDKFVFVEENDGYIKIGFSSVQRQPKLEDWYNYGPDENHGRHGRKPKFAWV